MPHPSKFKEKTPLQKRQKLVKDQMEKKPDHVVIIVEKDPICKVYPDLPKSTFSINRNQKVIEIHQAIRKRIVTQDKKFENHSLFIYSTKKIPNKESSIGALYESEKDKEDGILYLYYADMNPFGSFCRS